MIIVSQDGDETINYDKTFNTWISYEDKFGICADGEDLGRYVTEKRAKEVLQEIVEVLKDEDFFILENQV